MIATFGSYWLINYLNVIKAVNSFMHTIMLTLSDYQGVCRCRLRLWVSHMGHQTFEEKRGFGSVPHRNITFELQISHVQCYYGYLRVFFLIFLIVLGLFQNRDYTFFLTITTTATECDWLSFQQQKFFQNFYWMRFVVCVFVCGGGGGWKH